MSGPTLTHHILRTSRSPQTLAFYKETLGFEVVSERDSELTGARVFHLANTRDSGVTTGRATEVALELHQSEEQLTMGPMVGFQPPAGYWKMGLLVSDLDEYRERLVTQGLDVTQPRQFRDIGYLCHCNDPDGYRIEFLQRTFESSEPKCGQLASTLGHITLRTVDAHKSIEFYTRVMDMRLLSVQEVTPYEFTLYFLACTDERPPSDDLTDVNNREWLWQRPYTCIELQHYWGTQSRVEPYETFDSSTHGFWGLGFETSNLQTWRERLKNRQQTINSKTDLKDTNDSPLVVRDPDGYLLRVTQAG